MLKQRIITALILAPIVIGCVFFLPPLAFSIFIAFVLTVAAFEWAGLAGWDGINRYVYAGFIAIAMFGSWWLAPMPILIVATLWWSFAFILVLRYPALTDLWSGKATRSIIGVVMLVPGLTGLVQLKLMADSTWLILLLFLLIWGADIGAYFSGRAFGRRKLAPAVSPGKSWAGLYGGLVFAMFIAAGMVIYQQDSTLVEGFGLTQGGVAFLGICAFVVLVSVHGDLVESMFKRYCGVKDSGNLLPGHGGVLDRVDSLLAAAPVFALCILLFRSQ